MQHHPLGRASRKLHKIVSGRINKAISAMLGHLHGEINLTCSTGENEGGSGTR
jgi:hypothetical protein